ncbi:putative integral membrane protein [Nostocoides japonicum T1-X7]|uniref:Putative integral membrane protein n=1 Tax=Nostocoides japonicum T1-X7 TaxID=1194083 RepID=A0A077LYH9_9MICO|nr:Bax inhibitor-1/YccA family protein [Tetrasphaera japonica]CCH77020.1 putative integral membrane protein [Tetrasphaera japonica T1-X7]
MNDNPVFKRVERDARQGYAGFEEPRSTPQQGVTYGGPAPMSTEQLEDLYNRPAASAVQAGRVTMDDVVMKTAALFGLVVVFGAVGWTVSANNPGLGSALWLISIVATLGLGIAIAVKKTISVPLIVTYAVVEGLMVGAVSQFFNEAWPGVVVQAVLATLAVFLGMLVLYKTGVIKVTNKFRRIMTMAIVGYFIFSLVNLVYALVTHTTFGIGGTSGLGIIISLFATGLAAFTLNLDFDSIDRAIASGAPQKYSWLLAHGLIVTLVWLYLEMLRLLARFQQR